MHKKHENCNCKETDKKCKCNENCTCENDCTCNENNKCNENCTCNNNYENKEQIYLEMAQRVTAEFENYKKRTKEQEKQSFDNGIMHTISKLLPVLDSFKQAKAQIKDDSTLSGVNLIYNQMFAALAELGVKKIEAVGMPFNPNFHNAVMVDSTVENETQTVLEEFQEGFMLGDKVIRFSAVKISK